jgi:hypothetical protein
MGTPTQTKYSDKVAGDKGNYNWDVRFDLTEGKYLGITQYDGDVVKDRVLLTLKQVKALIAFGHIR